MFHLSQRSKTTLVRKIRHYKDKCFPGKGSGVRLAQEVGTTPQMISNWLDGSRIPTTQQMFRLAKAFDVSPLVLCGKRAKHATNPNTAHTTVLIQLLRYWGNDIVKNANPRITHKFLSEIKCLLHNDLF